MADVGPGTAASGGGHRGSLGPAPLGPIPLTSPQAQGNRGRVGYGTQCPQSQTKLSTSKARTLRPNLTRADFKCACLLGTYLTGAIRPAHSDKRTGSSQDWLGTLIRTRPRSRPWLASSAAQARLVPGCAGPKTETDNTNGHAFRRTVTPCASPHPHGPRRHRERPRGGSHKRPSPTQPVLETKGREHSSPARDRHDRTSRSVPADHVQRQTAVPPLTADLAWQRQPATVTQSDSPSGVRATLPAESDVARSAVKSPSRYYVRIR